ncbi:hypothetical protein LLG95_09215 [bacterium]|nr:hypothetical protein [bacterium]
MIPAIQSVVTGFGSPGNRSGDPGEIESRREQSDPDAHSENSPPESRRAAAAPPVRLQSTDPMVGTLLDVVA